MKRREIAVWVLLFAALITPAAILLGVALMAENFANAGYSIPGCGAGPG